MAFVLGFIVTIFAGLLLLGVALAILRGVFQLIGLLLKLVLALAAVGAAGLAGGSLAAVAASLHGGVEVMPAALAGGGLAVLLAVLWGRVWLTEQSPLPTVQLEPEPYMPPEPEGDVAVQDAWARAEALLPHDVDQLRKLRGSCARVLRAVREDGWDHALRDAAVLVRKYVPALIERTAQLLPDADPPERGALRAELLHSFAAIAEKADAAVDVHRAAHREALDLRHTHVRRRD